VANGGGGGTTTLKTASGTAVSGAITLTGAVSQSGQTFNFTGGSGSGIASLTGNSTGSTATTASAIRLSTTLTTNAGAATAQFETPGTGNDTANLVLNIPPAGAGTLTTLTGDATGSTPTSSASVNIQGGTVQRTGTAIATNFTTTAGSCALNLVLPPYISAGGSNTGSISTIPFTTNITNTASATSLAFSIDGTSQGVVLGGNISSAGSGAGVVAYGTLVVPATPGTLFSCWTGSGTAPAAPFVSLATGLRGGFIPATFSAATSLISFTWQLSTATPAALAQSVWAGAITSDTNTVTASCSTAFTAGQVIQWVLYG
jgi:hypothetical protein